jgi:putative peptidoglycan lipid II flippase
MSDLRPHPSQSSSGRGLFRSTLWVFGMGLACQVVGFFIQVYNARCFGAQKEMDAYLVANTLPQYLIAIVASAMSAVFIPVFVQYAREHHSDEDGWKPAYGLINQSALFLVVLVIAALCFIRPLICLLAPGLAVGAQDLAVKLAWIVWPAMVASWLLTMFTWLCQAKNEFILPGVVSFAAVVYQLLLVVLLIPMLGILGLVVAVIVSLGVQMLCLLYVVRRNGYEFSFCWGHPAICNAWRLLVPLLLSNILIRCTSVVERFLASGFAEGSIAQLNYAFKILVLASGVLAVGLPTTIYPRFAANVAVSDMVSMRKDISLGLRWLWLLIAPIISLGFVLAWPLTVAIFQRGRFTASDSQAVAHLLQIYIFALSAMTLGEITGRTLYALKLTTLLSVIGVVEALAYVCYVCFLAKLFGVSGIAMGFVLYYIISMSWHLPLIWHRTGWVGGRTALRSFARTVGAALVAGLTAEICVIWISHPWPQLLIGGVCGLLTYVGMLYLMDSDELRTIRSKVFGQVNLV